MDVVMLASGPACTIYAISERGTCPATEFIKGLEERDKTPLLGLLDFITEVGPLRNQEKFRNIGDDIYELKTRTGIRILAFLAPAQLSPGIVMTHGFRKPKKKVLVREKAKAIKWRQSFLDFIGDR